VTGASPEIRALIQRALALDYVSTSCRDNVKTANRYQSIDLGDERTAGFRSPRRQFFDQIDFGDKSVLDLGSNLGELTREARVRGAWLADGFEYDTFFVDLARLITAYLAQSRVSFFHRDITQPSVYTDSYDVVLAFAVYHYIHGVLEPLAAITEQALVVETHRLENNFESSYVRPLRRHFPHYRILGESDWGAPLNPRAGRVVAVFAKNASDLRAVMPRSHQARLLRASAAGDRSRATGLPSPNDRGELPIHIDTRRTTLQKRFFDVFGFENTVDLLAAVRSTSVDVDAMARSRDNRQLGYSGWLYWFLFLKGYLQFRDGKGAGAGNIYHDYLVNHYVPDPGVEIALSTPAGAQEYVQRQFEDADCCRQNPESAVDRIVPLFVSGPNRDHGGYLQVFAHGCDQPLRARRVDGWHRLFSARVFGVPWLRGKIRWDPPFGPVFGVVEHLDLSPVGRLKMGGWCIEPGGPVTSIALSSGDQVIARSDIRPRPDVAHSFRRCAYALNTGFDVDVQTKLDASTHHALSVDAFRAKERLGNIRVFFQPTMHTKRFWAPHDARNDPATLRRLAIHAIKTSHELLDPLDRFSHASFKKVGLIGDALSLLEPTLRDFMPHAQVVGVHWEPDLLDWCREAIPSDTFHRIGRSPSTPVAAESVDLVILYSLLSAYKPSVQRDWLSECARILQPEGVIVATVCGHAAARASMSIATDRELEESGMVVRDSGFPLTYQTRDAVARLLPSVLEMVDWLPEHVGERQDLVLLQKVG
jgi:SAM-dependent methyltransferase